MNDQAQIRDPGGEASPVRFKKILAPTDFSACADRAFAFALDLARRHGAVVQLMHVVGSVEGEALRHSPEARARQETPHKIVYDFLRETIEQHATEGVFIDPVVLHGDAVTSTILTHAKREGAGLIVMGMHGRHGMQRLLMGSVAERTQRLAPCPVLTVPAPLTSEKQGEKPPEPGIQRILVPIDFSEHAEPLLRAARELADTYGARLDLLHVVEMLLFAGMSAEMLNEGTLLADLHQQALQELRRLWKQVGGQEGQAGLHVEVGHAAAHIVDFAAQHGAGLIVMASQGRSGMERFLIGSVAERVARTAGCPVLTLKARSSGAAMPLTGRRAEPAARPAEAID